MEVVTSVLVVEGVRWWGWGDQQAIQRGTGITMVTQVIVIAPSCYTVKS